MYLHEESLFRSHQTSEANEYKNKKFLLLILDQENISSGDFFSHTRDKTAEKSVDGENKLVFLCNAMISISGE